ncbi:MAG: YbbR-like domain-containing protein [Tannerellaceae bacterium]|nr:YbbR-like domain-containing protein [Tannerellaceae bacterium]
MNRLEKIKESFKSANLYIRAFLQRQQWREALVFLFFVLLSFGFWVSLSLQQEYELTITIPVRYKNIPPDITFIHTPPDRVVARVKDKGSVLLNYSFGRTFSPIEINMRETSGHTGSLEVQTRDVEYDISKQLIGSTQLQTFEPSEIKVEYSQRAHKPVPVAFNGSILTQEGYALSGEITITPDIVEVFSNKEAIDTILTAQTVYTEIKNVTKPISRIIKLQASEGTAFEPEMVTINIPVEEFTEKSFEIPVRFIRVPSNLIIRAFPSMVKVNVHVPLSRYKDLTADEFAIEVDYGYLEENTTGVLSIDLTKKPEWASITTLQPDRIEFIFEQRRRDD